MKKYLFAILCLIALAFSINAQGNLALSKARVVKQSEANSSRILRVFKSDGSHVDYNSSCIDSVTADNIAQRIWSNGTCQSFPLEDVDSVWYINPALVISTPLVDFGKVSLGTTKSMSVCIFNTGEYPESFTLSNESAFVVDGVGRGEITLQPGKARNIWISYAPSSLAKSEGAFTVHSSALSDGLRTISICGEGVATAEEEEEADVVTYETVKVELPEGTDESFISKLELRNAYGRFPIGNMPARMPKMGNSYGPGSVAEFNNIAETTTAMIFNTIYAGDYPYVWQIRVPGMENEPIGARSTVLAMLMSSPQLVTDNPAEFNNLVSIITTDPIVSERFEELVRETKLLYWYSPNQCPDMSRININRVINALIHKFKSNESATINGISLKEVKQYNDTIAFKVVNDMRRSVHIYPQRVNLFDNTNFGYESQEYVSWKLKELLDALESDPDADVSDVEKEMVAETRMWLQDALESELPIPLPYIFDTTTASYWKIVEDAVTGNTSEAIYHVESEKYEIFTKGYDKLFLYIYGLGYDEDCKVFNSLPFEDQIKLVFAAVYSLYKDALMPLINIANGVNEVVKVSGGKDNYKYDLRYGARKYPEFALMQKLLTSWALNPQNTEDFKKNIKDKNVWGVISQIGLFLYDEILGTTDQENGNYRTYMNLIYNIIKKWTGITKFDDATRAKFKEAFNNLTYLKKANFIGKVVDVLESALDAAAYVQAFVKSAPQTTFVLNRLKDDCLTVVNPPDQVGHAATATSDGIINLEWNWYRGDNFGANYSYTIVLYCETANDVYTYEVPTASKDTKATVDITPLPGINRATHLWYRIVVHHQDNKETIYDQTGRYPIYTSAPSGDTYIDLGLPSGTLWSTANLGAANYQQDGDYYAWGETSGYLTGKNSFSWANYKYCKGAPNQLTKYVTNREYSYYGSTDDKCVLEDADDPAHLSLGYMYRIPSSAEWKELMDECSWSTIENGMLVKGKNGNVIFLPKAGYRDGVNKYDANDCGYYWTTDLDRNSPDDAWFTYFGFSKHEKLAYYRSLGRSIRPIFHMVKPDQGSPSQMPALQMPSVDKGGIYVERQLEGDNVVKTSCRTMIEANK